MTWGSLAQPELETPEEDPQLWLMNELRGRNFPPPGALRTRPANTNIIWSGVTQSGKSTSAAKLIIGFGDKSFLPSLRFHQAFTNDVKLSWTCPRCGKSSALCHLSISPLPLFRALRHDLRIMKTGSLEPRELPPGSWWLLDEPTDLNALDYWNTIIRAFTDLVTIYAFMGVNLAVMTPVMEQITGKLIRLTHLWIRQKRPGKAEVWAMIPWLPMKGRAKRKEFMQPIKRCDIVDEKLPPAEWMELYPAIKIFNAEAKADEWIEKLTKKGYIT